MNLLHEEILSEVYVVFPTSGAPRMFCTKLDGFTPETVQRVCIGMIEAAVKFGQMYGVQVHGTLGEGPRPPSPPAPASE